MTALTLSDVSRNFGGVQALSNVSFAVQAGERRLIIGPNGAGKTTLFNIVAGAIAASAGTVALFGRDITALSAHRRARMGVSRTFQITNLFPRLTVEENVLLALQATESGAFSLLRRMRGNRKLFDRTDALLQEWNLSAIAGREAREISYGEKRQVDLILAMALKPRVLLLDEPTAGLSAAEVVHVVGMIRGLPRQTTVLMIEHDVDVAFDLADRIAVLHQGRLLAEGDPASIRNDQRVADIYLGEDEADAEPC